MLHAEELWSQMKELYNRKWNLIDRKLSLWSEEKSYHGITPQEEKQLDKIRKEYEQIWREILKEEEKNPTIRVFGKHKDNWELIPKKE